MKRRMNVVNRRCSIYRYAVVIFVALAAVFCCLPSGAYAGGVYFGLGVDVPLPGRAMGPPVALYTPPVVVERAPPERVVVERAPMHRVVVEQPPQRVVVETAPPRVAYEEPVVIERRTSVTTTYYPAPRYREYHEETEREYYGRRSSYRVDESNY
jgi:hypothetical protein